MSIINKGTAFSNGEQLTADKLNDLVDLATFDQSATDSASTTVNSSGQIVVADGGITSAKLATDAIATSNLEDSTSKTDGVTLPKVQFIDTAKVLGRTTAGAGNIEELDFKTETDMVSDSDTAVASQKSIKAYVDASSTDGFTPTATANDTESVTLPNGLIMKFGVVENSPTGNTGVNIVTFGTAFPNTVLNAQLTWEQTNTGFTNPVYLKGNSVSTTGLTINNLSGTCDVYWQAIGR